MPEGLLEQQENSTAPEPMMDVYSPEGTKGKVPFSQWADYSKQGFKPAVRVTSPSGTGGWLPTDKVGDYTKNHGFKLGPPEQQKLSPSAPSSDPAKDKALTDLMGNGMPSQEDLNPTAEKHPVIASALNRVGQIIKGTAETVAKPPSGKAEIGSMVFGPVGPVATRLVRGQIEAEKQLAPQVMEQAKIAAASHAGQNPIRASIPTLEDARAATTALSMINPFASGSVANVNQLQDQGKPDQAAGEGITDALALGSGLKTPAKAAGRVTTDALATVKDAVPQIARPTVENSIVMRGIKNVKTAINPVDNMTAGELATKSIRPRNSKTNFPAELETALPDTKRALQNAGVDQSSMTLHDVLDAATQAKKDVWAEYQQNHSGPAGELQIDTTPIAEAMLSKITPRMRTQQPSLVKQIEANAAEYSGKSMAAQDLEQRVGEANNETRGIEAKYLTDKNAAKLDPSNAALFAERDTARQLLLSKLDEATGPGAAQLRQRYGNLNSFQDVVSRRIPVADRAAPMGLPQILAKMYGPGKIVGGLAQVATGVGAGHGIANIIEGGASMIGAKNARLMNDPDALIQHAFNKTEATPAARPYVAPPQPPIRGLLGEGPIITPPPADTSGSVPFTPPPIAGTSRAQRMGLMLPERTAIEAPPVPPQGREGLLSAASRIDDNGRVQYLTSPSEPGARPAPIARPNQQSVTPVPPRTPEPPQGAPAAKQPQFAYRTRNAGETGIMPTSGKHQASIDPNRVGSYMEGRGAAENHPQELVKIDLAKLDPSEYRVEPNGYVKFNSAVPEAFIEKMQPGQGQNPMRPKLDASKKVQPLESGAPVAGNYGSDTQVKTSTGSLPAKYKVVEADSLIPSHNAQTFAKNTQYPEGVQERDYARSKEAQNRVIQQAQNYDPAYTVNTNPDAVNGPPVVTKDGIVLGGNSRTMSTQRLYKAGAGDAYREAISKSAAQFGVSPEQIAGMKKPVLVREVESPANVEQARRIGADLNKNMTGAMGVGEKAVSAGRSVKPETLASISDMVNGMGEGSTLRDALRQNGKEVLAKLVNDGAISERERPQFVDTATGGLSEEGKTFVERALVGSVVDDPKLMDTVPKSVLWKLEGSLGDLSSVGARTDEYNLLPLVREALQEHADIASRGLSVENHLAQSGMFGPPRNSAVDVLVKALAEKPRAFRAAVKQYAEDARYDTQGQGSLGLGEKPSASKAFNDAFGSNLTEDQFHDALLQSYEKEGRIGHDAGQKATNPKTGGDIRQDRPPIARPGAL